MILKSQDNFHSYAQNIWKSNVIGTALKVNILISNVKAVSCTLCICTQWPTTERMIDRLQVFVNRYL